MRMDFHKYKSYEECPKKYHLKYVLRQEPKEKVNCYYIVRGNFIQMFFEMYCNYWRAENRDLSEGSIRSLMRPYWDYLIYKNWIDWDHPSSKLTEPELFDECIQIIRDNLEKFDVYADTKSEVKWVVTLKSGDQLVGKLDFLKNEEEIFDGKTNKTVGQNLHDEQLLFYAILYRFKYGKLPKSVKFLYYMHQLFDEVQITKEIVDGFWVRFLQVMLSIKKAKSFPANPCAKSCKYCDYLSECPEGKEGVSSRKRERKIIQPISPEVTPDGFQYF